MKRLLLVPLLFLALLTLAGCERYSWRQKLTLTVETPAGEVSASSVNQVSWRKHWIRTDGMGWDYDLTGEAVVVEVTPGRYLFALLKGAGTTEYMGSVAAASIDGRESRVIDGALFDEVRDKRDRAAGVIAVPAYQYPMLVTFADISDPASVELVDPENLAASFGPGVRLKSVVLEVTDEAVTEGAVVGLLAWLDQYRANQWRLNGRKCVACPITSNNLADLMSAGDLYVGRN
ncbi:MAG: hypothetical protein ACRC14_15010 [Paracoccaceae bacterium]